MSFVSASNLLHSEAHHADNASRMVRVIPQRCKQILCCFMTFFHERPADHPCDPHAQQFTDEELLAITPDDVLQWLNLRAYGDQAPTADMHPTMARSQSIKFWKKCLSKFMPNKHIPWNVQSNTGNPTRSIQVNDMIKDVTLAETRQQGALSHARRSTTAAEFRSLQTFLKNQDGAVPKHGYIGHNNFQYHMIGRIDDCTQALTENLQTHDTHPDTALKTKLPWSKNVREERDAPWQVLLGSMDALFCVLMSVALWLEIMISLPYGDATPYVFGFSADVRVPQGGFKNKTNLQKYARDFIFNRPEFGFNANDPNSRNLLGSHSIRKHASSVCRNKGCAGDKRTTEEDGKTEQGHLTCMMISNCPLLMLKLQPHCALGDQLSTN